MTICILRIRLPRGEESLHSKGFGAQQGLACPYANIVIWDTRILVSGQVDFVSNPSGLGSRKGTGSLSTTRFMGDSVNRCAAERFAAA